MTLLAVIAFASNSLLCRLALKETNIDPASFTLVRILAGAGALSLIVVLRQGSLVRAGNWFSGLSLFVYAAGFSYAYVSIPAGTGALLLFGAVQATMILWGLVKGERLNFFQIIGLSLAIAGLIVLVLPGVSAPPLFGAVLMLGAGVAWGIYSLRGKGEQDPALATTGNFLRALPFSIVLALTMCARLRLDLAGVSYAAISGAITSGLGYIVWYGVLPQLRATSAATVQLSVPVLVATGGILLLGEPVTIRYFLASAAILGGVALVILRK